MVLGFSMEFPGGVPQLLLEHSLTASSHPAHQKQQQQGHVAQTGALARAAFITHLYLGKGTARRRRGVHTARAALC